MEQTFKLKTVMHLTEKYQQTAADKLIAKLRQDLAAANEYILELEDGESPKIKELQKQIEELKKENSALQKKFNSETKELDKEARVAQLLEDRKALKKENERLLNIRDHLLYLIHKKIEPTAES